MERKQLLKPGEKVLFAVFGAFLVLAIAGLVVMEVVRAHMSKPMFASRASFDLSAAGRHGSKLFREAGCTACHRAMRNGTNQGIGLDGVGSLRSQQWLEAFLKHPEANWATVTIDHGQPPKEAAYVAQLPPQDLHDIAMFLSELKAERGSATSAVPPPEIARSGFVNSMTEMWAPEAWKEKYQDIRHKKPPAGETNEPQ
ncbi:MAG: cytochrome c [Gammaproteobacteria bacterium]|nr:cytochrome c [Gammaproteobacteria bacterium]